MDAEEGGQVPRPARRRRSTAAGSPPSSLATAGASAEEGVPAPKQAARPKQVARKPKAVGPKMGMTGPEGIVKPGRAVKQRENFVKINQGTSRGKFSFNFQSRYAPFLFLSLSCVRGFTLAGQQSTLSLLMHQGGSFCMHQRLHGGRVLFAMKANSVLAVRFHVMTGASPPCCCLLPHPLHAPSVIRCMPNPLQAIIAACTTASCRSAAGGRLNQGKQRLRRINGKVVRMKFKAPAMAGQVR